MPTGGPLGTTPFGTGTPATAQAPPVGAPIGARFVDPVAGQYEMDAVTGHLRGMPATRQRFLLLLRTLRGSSSVLPAFGVDLPVKMDETFERRVRASVRFAARQMTEVERVARIERIDVAREGGRAKVLIVYRDLERQISDAVQGLY